MGKFSKLLWHGGATAFWIGFIVSIPLWFILIGFGGGCSYEEHESFYSPEKKLRAVIYNVNCGATTNWQTQIFVEKVDGSDKTKSLIRLDGRPTDVNYQVTWLSEEEVLISDFDFDQMLGINKQGWGRNFVRVRFKLEGS